MSVTKLPKAVEDLYELHAELCAKGFALMERKNNDYRSGTGDPFKNFRGASTFDVSPVRGILLRMQDKMCRIATFDEKGELLVKDEGVEDAIVDIINYAVLMAGLIREDKNAKAVHSRGLGGLASMSSVGVYPNARELFAHGRAFPTVLVVDKPPATRSTPRSVPRGLREGGKPGKGAGRKK